MTRKAIVTMPPYATHLDEVLEHPAVEGIRLNTVMPIKDTKKDLLERLCYEVNKRKKDLWIDLKTRQLRIRNFGVPPFTEIELSHEINVYTPCIAYFSGKNESARVLEVKGNKLIMEDGPRRVVGPGESVNIPHPTLEVKGFLTQEDIDFISAAKEVGIHKYILSFAESKEDVEALKNLDADAEIRLKIESRKGVDYALKSWNGEAGLMTARGDLYLELKYPHVIPKISYEILKKDKNAVVASRLLDSLAESPEPSCSDIGDLDSLLRMGYKTFMFGDEICLRRDSIIRALNVFERMARLYEN